MLVIISDFFFKEKKSWLLLFDLFFATIHPVIVHNTNHTSQVDEEAKVEAVKAFYQNPVVDHGRVKRLNFISKNIDTSHFYLFPPS